MNKTIRILEEMLNNAKDTFIDVELKNKESTCIIGINTKAYLQNIEELNTAIDILKNKKYTDEELDEILTKQREICSESMEKWCEVNGIKKSGHIVLYTSRP
jgi:hypothetical protein